MRYTGRALKNADVRVSPLESLFNWFGIGLESGCLKMFPHDFNILIILRTISLKGNRLVISIVQNMGQNKVMNSYHGNIEKINNWFQLRKSG